MKEFRCAAYTYMGRRTRNQDNFLLNGQILEAKHGNDTATASGILSGPLFFAVVDGAGTKTTGEMASYLICQHLWDKREKFEEVNEISEIAPIINEALQESNADIEAAMVDEPTSKMGGTAAVLLIYNGKVLFGNVGDSGIYLRRDGKVTKLTRDHTEGQELVARGALTEDMLRLHSSKTHVTRKIGYMTFGQTDIMQFYEVTDVRNDDIFILASPGIVQYLYPNDIDSALQTGIDPSKCVERIVKSAMDHESKDNTTVMVIRVSDQVDHVGNKNVKVKPIRTKQVHVHTSIDIDPHVIKVLAYVVSIVFMLSFSVIYLICTYPEKNTLKHYNQDGYSWTEQGTLKGEEDTPGASDNTDSDEAKGDVNNSDSGQTQNKTTPTSVPITPPQEAEASPEVTDNGDAD